MATVSVLRCQRSKALQDIEQAQYSTAMRGHQHPRTARQQIEHSMSISAPLRDDSGIGQAGEVGDYAGASDGLAPAAGADQHEQPRTEIPT